MFRIFDFSLHSGFILPLVRIHEIILVITVKYTIQSYNYYYMVFRYFNSAKNHPRISICARRLFIEILSTF